MPKCKRGHNSGTHWIKEPPESTHEFRVQCSQCKGFIKWGARAEFESIKHLENVIFVPYAEAEPEGSISQFFSEGD